MTPSLLGRVNRRLPVLRAAYLARLAWWRLRRPVVLGVRAIILDGDGRVLLIRHSYLGGWHLPGGGVDRGESVAGAVRREVREEVGIEVTDSGRLLGLQLRLDQGASNHVATYVVAAWRGRPVIDAVEIVDVRFFAMEALPDDVSAGTRRRLDEFRGLTPVAEVW